MRRGDLRQSERCAPWGRRSPQMFPLRNIFEVTGWRKNPGFPCGDGQVQPWLEAKGRARLRAPGPRRGRAQAALESRGRQRLRGCAQRLRGNLKAPHACGGPGRSRGWPAEAPGEHRMIYQRRMCAVSSREPRSNSLSHKGNLLALLTEKSTIG